VDHARDRKGHLDDGDDEVGRMRNWRLRPVEPSVERGLEVLQNAVAFLAAARTWWDEQGDRY